MPKAGHSLSQSSLGDKTKEKNKDEKAEVTMEYQNKSK